MLGVVMRAHILIEQLYSGVRARSHNDTPDIATWTDAQILGYLFAEYLSQVDEVDISAIMPPLLQQVSAEVNEVYA